MEFIESNQLLHCMGNMVPAEKAFKGRRIVLLYFGSSTSTPCKQFLPKLKQVYQKSKEIHVSLEIIYVGYDTEEAQLTDYFTQRHGGWYAVQFGDPAILVLRIVYGVTHIPALIVLGPGSNVISRTGIQDFDKLGLNVLVAWLTLPPK